MKDSKKHRYAKTTNIDIRPIIESDDTFNYLFRKRIFAQRKLGLIRERYIISVENQNLSTDEVLLWIRNYDVSAEDREAGYKGNYGRIYIKKIDPNDQEDPDSVNVSETSYAICIEKIEKPVSHHPQRKIVKHRHPNWGHPILRQIRNTPDFQHASHFEARNELKRLSDEYPDVSILTSNQLYIMIYAKEKEHEGNSKRRRPIQKIILEIKEIAEDHFTISWRKNPVEGILERDKINLVSFSFFS